MLGVIDATIPASGDVQLSTVSLSSFAPLKGLASGKHEMKLTSASISITVATKLGNDGEIVARLIPKNWSVASASKMKEEGAAYRHVSVPPWGVNLSSPGDWVGVANSAAYIQIGGYALEKETKISILLRGNVHFR